MADFFVWWYGDNFKKNQKIGRYLLIKTWDSFSVGLLLKSIFAPWKADVSSSRGQPINIMFRMFIMNLFSRLIGFVIRSLVILIGFIASLAIIILNGIGFAIYLVLPFAPIILLILGIIIMV